MLEYLVIADDFTGANETAVKFMNGGHSSSVILEPDKMSAIQNEYSTVALDTETFYDPPLVAEQKLRSVSKALLPWKNRCIFYKRIDPIFRGNAALEIKAFVEEIGFKYVVIANAFSIGRKAVEDGVSMFDSSGMLGAQRNKRHVASAQQSAESMRAVGIEPVCLTKEQMCSGAIENIITQNGYFCCEADDESDLALIVHSFAAKVSARDILWVGSVGLADVIATLPKPVLTILGSVHPRSIRQAKQLVDLGIVKTVEIDFDEWKTHPHEQRKAAAMEAEKLLRSGKNVLLAIFNRRRFIGEKYPDDNLDSFLGFLADVASDIIERVKLAGVNITGGDCSVRLVTRLKANGIRLIKEVQEGITLSCMEGGSFNGLPLVTKAGGFGGERALIHAIEYLLNKQTHSSSKLPLA